MPRGTSELPSARLAFVVIAASAGGISAIGDILANLTADFPAPIAMVQHRAPIGPVLLAQVLQLRTMLIVKDAESGDVAQAGSVYLAPQNHHLVVMNNGQLGLSSGPKVNFSRPSADLLFSSAADVFGRRLIAVILTGANGDAAAGALAVKANGGRIIVQDPASAQASAMPRAAIAYSEVDWILPLDQIAAKLVTLVTTRS